MIDNLINIVKELKFQIFAFKNPKEINTSQNIRNYCIENACGNYGKNRTCPPNIGEVKELEKKLHSYENAIIVQNIYEIEDSLDFFGMFESKKKFDILFRELIYEIRSNYKNEDFLFLGCGGCSFCDKCSYPAPCRYPEEALSSIEGYGIDVAELIKSVGLNYINGVNTVTFIGLILINQEK